MHHYLIYWKPATVKANSGNETLMHTASDQYGKLQIGDVLWVVSSLGRNNLLLVGRQHVDQVIGQECAERELGATDLWEAKYHVLCDEPEEIACVDISHIASRLRFKGVERQLPEGFTGQHLQAMRRLSVDSAPMMERLWHQRDELLAVKVLDKVDGRA